MKVVTSLTEARAHKAMLIRMVRDAKRRDAHRYLALKDWFAPLLELKLKRQPKVN